MGSPLPDDPYLALGVAKDATAAAIKTQYRKLVLKCHPDKIQDEAQKKAAVDRFHKIQTAYEILGDEDKKARYDAQCKLAQLRKDVMERQGASVGRGAEVRTTAYKMPTEAPRGGAFYTRGPERAEKVSPQYDVRQPASTYATDYFDGPARTGSRKEPDSARKRTSPRSERGGAKGSPKQTKESERAKQKERSRRADRDIRKDRDRKAYVDVESDSDSDEYERYSRKMKEEDDLRRARNAYQTQAQTYAEDVRRGYYDGDARAQKVFSQYDKAREYMEAHAKKHQQQQQQQRPAPERRPSPVRVTSSKDRMEYIRRSDGKPVAVRRDPGRTRSGRDGDDRRYDEFQPERRSSTDGMDDRRRPANLQHSKSSPAEIHLPGPYEKPRSQSMQADTPERDGFVPRLGRSQTMPVPPLVTRERETRRKETTPAKSSTLRQAEIVEELTTPAPGPTRSGPSPSKYNYRNHEYADEHEYPTPDGYRTFPVEPSGIASKPKMTRSPSPMRGGERERERERERGRTNSARYQTSPQRSAQLPRTTSYVYNVQERPSISRENSSRRRDEPLYGEIRTASRSPREHSSRYAPPPEVPYRREKEIRPQDLRTGRRVSERGRPSYSRSGSGQPILTR